MKLIFDHQIFSLQNQGGISRYIFKLSEQLKLIGVDAKIKVAWSENIYLRDKKSLPKFLPWRIRQLSYLLLNQLDDFIHPEKNIDVLHATYYGMTPLRKYAKKTAVTVFDMNHELGLLTPSVFDKTIKHKHAILKNSDIIYAISNSTKNDINQFYPDLKKMIYVTYLGSDIAKYAKSTANHILNHKDFILYVGNRTEYKNFFPYLSAVAPLLIENETKLVAFGGGVFTTDEKAVIDNLKLSDLVFHVSGVDDVLAKHYQKALFLAYPSLSEGFGLPIIEAFALGCPVLTSSCSSMKEIGANATAYFDPNSAHSMLESTKKMLTNDKHRHMLHLLGLKRAELFSWDKTACDTKTIYEAALKSNN